MAAVGFEPTPPKRLVPKTSALDRIGHATSMKNSFVYNSKLMSAFLLSIAREDTDV